MVVCVGICQSVLPLSVDLSDSRPVYLLSTCLFTPLFLSVCLSLSLSVIFSVCLSVCVCLSVYERACIRDSVCTTPTERPRDFSTLGTMETGGKTTVDIRHTLTQFGDCTQGIVV